MIITFGFAYNSVQSNTICLAWQKAFGIDPATMGIILTALTLLIIFGGIQRVAKFSSTVVPVMAVVYLLIAVGVVIWNITSLPKVLLIIIENAFGFNQAAGGVLGVTVIQGIKRGLFSNEAGEGSAPNAAAVATVSHPVKQGLIQALGVFTDTLVVCSCTAFIILMSGVDVTASNGIQLTQDALTHEIGRRYEAGAHNVLLISSLGTRSPSRVRACASWPRAARGPRPSGRARLPIRACA